MIRPPFKQQIQSYYMVFSFYQADKNTLCLRRRFLRIIVLPFVAVVYFCVRASTNCLSSRYRRASNTERDPLSSQRAPVLVRSAQ
jgi:hypothetical protein